MFFHIRRLRVPAGAPLDWGPFTVVATRSQPWGHEATVSDFDLNRLEALLASRTERSLEVVGLTLEEIFLTVCGTKGEAE